MTARIRPGDPHALGATWDGDGVNFAVFSEEATTVEVCLFDARGGEERLTLPERTAFIHHGYVAGLAPGQLYGFRAHGAWDPLRGRRFNAAKVLVDPYARAIANEVDWTAPLFAHRRGAAGVELLIDDRDDAWGAPKSVVVDPAFDWGDDRAPRTPWTDTVIYETHVKGLTARHPGVPSALRGTYAGLASESAIGHLKRLGVTAVELLPVHEKTHDEALVRRGLSNYWGYNTLGYFAPEGEYAATGRVGQQVTEFKAMVRALHKAGLEVILDVVYNHTGEGDRDGPALCFKGLDNRAYYRLRPEDLSRYEDLTGCGNTLDVRHPQVLKLVMDSLRYWAVEMRVDGFRFDLAPVLGRDGPAFRRSAAFLIAIHQDPVLSRTKLIAEPWDLGDGGYQVGNFPVFWGEWNGRYRDAIRRFWKGEGVLAEIGYRLTGSSDLYEMGGRSPSASINFVTAHDGFTLADLVSYSKKHNEANGEANKDGTDSNDSDNCGVEGATSDPAILELRERQKRNLVTTLMLSQGVPMLLGGDEFGRTQRGNNNAYCQDNDTSWHDWDLDVRRSEMLDFVARLAGLRASEPTLRRKTFFSGGHVAGTDVKDIVWFGPDGREFTAEAWSNPDVHALGMMLAGGAEGSTLLILKNAGSKELTFVLPAVHSGEAWETVIDTRSAQAPKTSPRVGTTCVLAARSLVVMKRTRSV